MRGRYTEARLLLARLAGTSADAEEVDAELTNIKDALEAQSRDGPFKMKELLHNGPSQNLRRTLLGVVSQFFQQISGINLIVRIPSNIAVVNHKLTLLALRPTTQPTSSRTHSDSAQTCPVYCPPATVPSTSSPD